MPFDIKRIEKAHGITWDELVELEPHLEVLLDQVEASRPIEGAPDFNYEICWGQFKAPISKLVGWHRRHGDERLRTTHAYEIAYYTLWHALHD